MRRVRVSMPLLAIVMSATAGCLVMSGQFVPAAHADHACAPFERGFDLAVYEIPGGTASTVAICADASGPSGLVWCENWSTVGSNSLCGHWVVFDQSTRSSSDVVLCDPSSPSQLGTFVVQYPTGGGPPVTRERTFCPGGPSPQPTETITPAVTGVPSSATAVLANLTMTGGTAAGYITADRCSALVSASQAESNGNYVVRRTIANLSVVPVDADGRFCIYNSRPVHLIADVQGHFAPPAAGGQVFTPSVPIRTLDTRQALSSPLVAGSITRVATGVAVGTTAVLVNLTMTGGALSGYITADKCSLLVAGPQTKSNGNFTADTSIANLSVVPVDSDGSFCIYNERPVHLVVDLQGAFAPSSPSGLQFTLTPLLSPTRRLDTRIPSLSRPVAGSITRVVTGVAAGTIAVLVNLTMVGSSTDGYITADECSSLVAGPQSNSNGNFPADAAIANLSVVPVDADGSFCIYNEQPVHLIVDLQGTFSSSGTQQFFAGGAARVLDTRND